ncbi:MAG TPA: TlpA disulfide reductase family protein, partial [Acetobacteraceae bacterium]|nr:TlpA disulfide reductase family protein [Acetobacteraceae bacterium]
PDIHFTLADGTARTLRDYAGQGIVLNFWATWCVPCVAEMPALAKLAGLVSDARVAVLPLSSDRGGAAAVERFYREKGIEGLPVLLDPRGEAARAFGSRGIPTTVLIDARGRERGRLEGAADWADADAVAAVKELAK